MQFRTVILLILIQNTFEKFKKSVKLKFRKTFLIINVLIQNIKFLITKSRRNISIGCKRDERGCKMKCFPRSRGCRRKLEFLATGDSSVYILFSCTTVKSGCIAKIGTVSKSIVKFPSSSVPRKHAFRNVR